MINLHQRYNHYLHTEKKLDINNEKVLSYGWVDNGTELTGHYVLTETEKLLFDMKGQYLGCRPHNEN